MAIQLSITQLSYNIVWMAVNGLMCQLWRNQMDNWLITFRNIYRLALWICVILGSLANDYMLAMLSALLLVVLQLEEISEKMDND